MNILRPFLFGILFAVSSAGLRFDKENIDNFIFFADRRFVHGDRRARSTPAREGRKSDRR